MAYLSYSLAALLLLGTTACRRTDASPAIIMGKWQWVSSVGGIAGMTYTPASTGATETLVFQPDSTYQRVYTPQSGTAVTTTGTFSLRSVKSIHTGQVGWKLILRWPQSQRFLIVDDLSTRLVLSDDHPDGFKTTYKRNALVY